MEVIPHGSAVLGIQTPRSHGAPLTPGLWYPAGSTGRPEVGARIPMSSAPVRPDDDGLSHTDNPIML
ncbi:unnamed protein product [Gongylonema pulchrum]|uniref:Uncharacterized protein n=1 Tax=Gongylonema pulchrum TaxID=637853 RepID=A0A183E0N1_9BILA|nr:unnamed protein product [Gongylonema pulchrum]